MWVCYNIPRIVVWSVLTSSISSSQREKGTQHMNVRNTTLTINFANDDRGATGTSLIGWPPPATSRKLQVCGTKQELNCSYKSRAGSFVWVCRSPGVETTERWGPLGPHEASPSPLRRLGEALRFNERSSLNSTHSRSENARS